MKLITWNINSVRLRLPLLLRLMNDTQADVIALQETKCPDEFFPRAEIEKAGYKHIHIHGMKSYNGVAILSKIPFEKTGIHDRVKRSDCRHIASQINGIEFHNLYIPAGGDIPDPDLNDKFKHKLDYVEDIADYFTKNHRADQRLIALGDFNIAPHEHDVWSHKQLLNVVSHTPPETTRLLDFQKTLDWVDTSRHFIPLDQKAYTWWSYRNRDWKKSNRGRRLDHVWATQPLKKSLKAHAILQPLRDWDGPSDHVPVLVELGR